MVKCIRLKGGGCANTMANRVMRHPLGYNCNLYTGIEDQLKTLNVHETRNDLLLRYY